jgi:NAD(P)-dependent dehydrogenase (short-subunit alcohol dehydrogenase family)
MSSNMAARDGTIPGVPRVAVLGTGKMGSAIAGRLSEAGFSVVLWNRTRSRAEALGIGSVAETPAAAARAPRICPPFWPDRHRKTLVRGCPRSLGLDPGVC